MKVARIVVERGSVIHQHLNRKRLRQVVVPTARVMSVAKGKLYEPNGRRECERRLRQAEKIAAREGAR